MGLALLLAGLALLIVGCGGDAPAADLGVVDQGSVDLGPDAGDGGLDASGPRLDAPDLLRLPYVDDTELVMDLLRQGPDVQVLAPAALRNKVRLRLQQALKNFD